MSKKSRKVFKKSWHSSESLSYNHYNSSPTEKYILIPNCSKEQPHNEDEEKDEKATKGTEFASVVANHYNSLPNSIEGRKESSIFFLRNFNNWIKSVLIKENVAKLKNGRIQVLDMCCGKGGDMLKWERAGLSHIIFTDIAEKSLEECETRYKNMIEKQYRDRNPITSQFIAADCTRVRLKDKYNDPNVQLDIVSCQFSFHYCFESLPQAECMIRNAAECLKPGGYFIGTMPNAYEIVKRIKLSNDTNLHKYRKNRIYSIDMYCSEPYPLFGAKYDFYLDGVVNCPEFLVHFPTFVKLAAKYGLKFKNKETFMELFQRKKITEQFLLEKMKALETYDEESAIRLQGPEYYHAKIMTETSNISSVGTLSKSEAEVISLYLTFVFQKQ